MAEGAYGAKSASRKGKRYSDQTLYVSLVKAHEARAITISVDADRLNRPGSPVWDPMENLVPIALITAISIVIMLTVNILAGVGALVLGALAYTNFLRSWILTRVATRARKAAIENLHNWELIWRKGRLAITLAGAVHPCCSGPTGDWRACIARNFPPTEISGAEFHLAGFAGDGQSMELHSGHDPGADFT